jgi:hypothetical protein
MKRRGYGHWLVALAALALLAFLLFFILMMMPKGGLPLLFWGAKPQRIIASIEVEGRGSVSANGTSTLFWNSTKPFKLVLEAKPERCWAFKGWVANGSFLSAEPSVALTVRGNTTVKAVFEKVALLLALRAPLVPANVSGVINGTPASLVVGGAEQPSAELAVSPGSRVVIEPLKLFSDPQGCSLYNDTHIACFSNWVVNGTPTAARVLNITIYGDTVVEGNATLAKRRYPVAYTEAILPNGSRVKVPVIPAERYMGYLSGIVRFACRYEYLGNGWFKIEGAQAWTGKAQRCDFLIPLPESWRKIRITANYTRLYEYAYTPTVFVLCKYLEPGVSLTPYYYPGTAVNAFIIDRAAVVGCVGDLRAPEPPFRDPSERETFRKVVRTAAMCLWNHTVVEAGTAGPTVACSGYPCGASYFNVPLGTLLFSMEDGTIYLKIEVLEVGG